MKTNKYRRKIKSLITRIRISINEKKYKGLPYLYQKKGTDTLMIVFSAFTGGKRRYNYVSSFSSIKSDKLFVLDPWGHLGSYYLFENGEGYPQEITLSLINNIIFSGKYKSVITAGTSKGGTCAIYYGLTIGANEIFSGACQYNVGDYVWREEFRGIFYGMMGKDAGQEEVDLLNDIVKAKVREARKGKSMIHVFYSKKEKTYERHIIDLLSDLKKYEVPFVDIESDFEKHELVAEPFVKYVNNYLGKTL